MDLTILKNTLNKIRKDKKMLVLIAIGLAGMLLILLSETGSETERKSENSEYIVLNESELAAELEKLIENIDGAGKTKVMITFDCYEETVYAYDLRENISEDGDRDSEREYILIDSGQTQQGLKLKMISPVVKGVAVVCQGGNSSVIREQITSAVSALFDISSNKISVALMA